ncbi:hypothetical protein OG558_23840 [Kribbella sp. NBC_01510]
MPFFLAADVKSTGSSRPIRFWEEPGVVETRRTIRKYCRTASSTGPR